MAETSSDVRVRLHGAFGTIEVWRGHDPARPLIVDVDDGGESRQHLSVPPEAVDAFAAAVALACRRD